MNVIIGIVCLVIAAFLYASTLGYPHKSSIGILPGTWPQMIACLIGICSVILIVQDIVSKRKPLAIRFTRESLMSSIVPGVIVMCIVLYIAAWSYWRTFFLPTFFLATIIVVLLKRGEASKFNYIISGICGLVLTTLIYIVFYYVFRLPL